MIPSSHQFLVDTKGNKVGVVIGVEEYERLREIAAEAEALHAFPARAPDDSTAIFDDRPPERGDELAALGFRSFP